MYITIIISIIQIGVSQSWFGLGDGGICRFLGQSEELGIFWFHFVLSCVWSIRTFLSFCFCFV